MKLRSESIVGAIIVLGLLTLLAVGIYKINVYTFRMKTAMEVKVRKQDKGFAELAEKIKAERHSGQFDGHSTIIKHIGDLPGPMHWDGGGRNVSFGVGKVKTAEAYGNEYMKIVFVDGQTILLNAVEPILPGKILYVWGEYNPDLNVFYTNLPLRIFYSERVKKLFGRSIKDAPFEPFYANK